MYNKENKLLLRLYCILPIILYIQYIEGIVRRVRVHCTVNGVHCTVYIIQCTLYSIHDTKSPCIFSEFCSVKYTMYNVHCTLHMLMYLVYVKYYSYGTIIVNNK